MRKGKNPEPDPYLSLKDPDPGGPKTYGSDAEPDPASQNDAYPCRSRSATLVTRHQEMYLANLDHNGYKDVSHSFWNFQYKKPFLGRPTCDSIRLNQLGIVSSWLVEVRPLVLLPRQQLAQDQARSILCKSTDSISQDAQENAQMSS
jgi:hypothetical protein